MKKSFYIIAGILVALIVVLATILYIYKKDSLKTPPSAPVQIPSLPLPTDLKEKGKTAISSGQENIIINDPYKDALKIVSGNAEMKNTAYYEIVYLGDLKSFVITLYGDNLNDSRNKAEQAFLESLGINKDEACKLKVTLAVAPEASKSVAGKNYGLSFCPNGKPFPSQ